jgi:hypothetical protein
VLIDFVETSEPAQVPTCRWDELLHGGADDFGSSPGPSAAVRLGRPARSAAGRRSTG